MNREGSKRLVPEDWLLAETTRRREEAAGDFQLDESATRTAAVEPGSTEERIVRRAGRLPGAQETSAEIRQFLGAARWMILLLMLLGLLAGATATSGIETGGNTIALSNAVLVLLGVPLMLLLLWSILNLSPKRESAPGLPGRIIWWLLLVLSRRFGMAARRRHLAGALAELGRKQGRTLMALATHAFWTMFFIGCIGWLWLRFLGLRFDFSWETTLLSGPWLENLILAIGWLPAWLFGLSLPDPDQVQEALAGRSGPGDRSLWAGYLIGALTVYGLLPRLLLGAWFLFSWRRSRIPLDLGRPGYLRLLPALSGPSRATGRRGKPPPDPGAVQSQRAFEPVQTSPGAGDAVLVGVELDRDDADWPPEIPGCRVLGRADDRRQRREILQSLALLDPRPEKIVALCSLARSPDRGTLAFLAELAGFAPLEVRLADAERLEKLQIDPAQRLADWQGAARQAGLASPIAVDPALAAAPSHAAYQS